MTESSYTWGEPFQLRLLTFLLRDPEKALDLVEPKFFTNPMMVDIARIIRDLHKAHPKNSISIPKVTLKELVKNQGSQLICCRRLRLSSLGNSLCDSARHDLSLLTVTGDFAGNINSYR